MTRTIADHIYFNILNQVHMQGDFVDTRNHLTKSAFWLDSISFTSAPLVTLRKTAWQKALREMEWFLSGQPKCPPELLNWWEGQLDKNDCLIAGYGHQFRQSLWSSTEDEVYYFDQITFIKDALKTNPNSRRLLLTSWNPGEMAHITGLNDNPNTPTCCHNTMTQFFVRNGGLSLRTYQRSADLLLGVPHNWIQTWAMLVWFAHHAGLEVDEMIWDFGDAHIYQEESHIQVVNEIVQTRYNINIIGVDLLYHPTSEQFKASDFCLKWDGEISQPVTTVRPKLL